VTLDQGNVVHVDLHGLFLSGDFEATFANGEYKPGKGTDWMISDGGAYRSTDGGKHFTAAQNIQSLSVVNIAGVALPGKGPALSLNSGDNDGFYSMDGGALEDTRLWRVRQRLHLQRSASASLDAGVHAAMGQTQSQRGGETGQYSYGLRNFARQSPGHPGRYGPRAHSTGSAAERWQPDLEREQLVLNMPGDDPTAPGDCAFVRLRAGAPSVVVRTRDILNITDRAEWDANSDG
jgi:hypothetical protein